MIAALSTDSIRGSIGGVATEIEASELQPELQGFARRLEYAVRTRREQRNISQNKVAVAAGVDGGNLTKYLKGEKLERIAAVTVLRLAKALDVRPEWLLTGEEPSGLEVATARAAFRHLSEVPEEAVREEGSSDTERDRADDRKPRARKHKR
jgi:transcriptional regulator with XRE-family HTH domain